MGLIKLLEEKKVDIVKDWIDMVSHTYAQDTAYFLKNQKDRFANPVGFALNGLKNLYEEIIGGMQETEIIKHLDLIVRIRAVQDFSASKAIEFVYFLKQVIIKNLENKNNNLDLKELFELFEKIDKFALIAFDIYMQCREKIYQVKVNELKKSRVFASE